MPAPRRSAPAPPGPAPLAAAAPTARSSYLAAFIAISSRPWHSRPHSHPCYELLYISRGRKRFLLNGVEHRAGPGDLVIFRPGDVHQEWSLSPTMSRMVIRFQDQDVPGGQVAFPAEPGAVVRLPWRQRFQDLFARMAEEYAHPHAHSGLLLGAWLVEFVVLLRRAAEALATDPKAGSGGRATRIRSAIEMIHTSVDRSLSLGELARSVFLSPSHFSRRFRAEAGAGPKQYLIKARLDQARHLLATSDLTAQEIAARLGYANPYYFYRLFKQKTGITAGAYARGARRRAAREAVGGARKKVHG